MQIRVAITSPGGEAERAPEFTKPEISIGRLPSNDVVLPEAGVSSNHARVLVTGGALTILDLDSTNGTFVNDEPLQGPRVLGDGDEVQIGDFVLRFALHGAAGLGDVVHGSAAPRGRAAAGAPATMMDASGAWPEQPPMMDDLDGLGDAPGDPHGVHPRGDDDDAPELAVRRSPVLGRAATPTPQPRAKPGSEPPRPAVFPRFEARRGSTLVAARSDAAETGFEFAPASADQLVDRVFTAVWLRVADDVLLGTAGIRDLAARLLDEALHAVGGPLQAQRDTLRARMLDEMVGDGPLRSVLDAEPNEVLVHGMTRVRVQRAGHVSEGPSPFTCPSALRCFVSRSLGVHFDPATPVVRGSWGAWSVEAVWGTGVAVVVSLRRSVLQGSATLESLVHAGALSPNMGTLLATAAMARYSILVCAAPGASGRGALAALLACAPPQELQVVVTHRGAELGGFRPGTVAVARSGRHDAIDAALALAPDRVAIDDLQWDEAVGALAVVSRSVGVLAGLRAHGAAAGLTLLGQLLGGALPGVTIEPLVAQAFDLVVSVQLFADGMSRVTSIAEPFVHDGRLGAQDIFTLVPGTRTWQFSGVLPRCNDELGRRGFRLDPAVFS